MAQSGVVFPVSGDPDSSGGEPPRSTSALGRAVVAAALESIDPIGARSARQETSWRTDYLSHFRRLVEAGLTSGDDARRSAADGLAALHDRMRVITPDGEIGLRDVFTSGQTGGSGRPESPAGGKGSAGPGTGGSSSRGEKSSAGLDGGTAGRELVTGIVTGDGDVERELSVPYRGDRLGGDDLRRRLDDWVTAGVIEPSCAEAVRAVQANPDWLDLSDQRVVVLGAGAEMGPTQALLRWGADVVAVDLPRPALWTRLFETANRYGGRLHVPLQGPANVPSSDRAGADLLHDLPSVANWLTGIEGRLVIGNYVYADGATNVRVSVAVDALTERLRAERADVALAFLATPTDVFAVPADAVVASTRAYRESSVLRTLRQPLRLLSAGRLLRRNYAPDADPGICDSLVSQQGPNYALAKRLQRWRAAVARQQGATVSFKVAPPTRTRSVLKNRALAAAYAGAHVFGVEVFEPATSNTLMAALLVHDLRNPPPVRDQVWQEEATGAAHGGLWRMPYAPRSALGLAALVGLGGARG